MSSNQWAWSETGAVGYFSSGMGLFKRISLNIYMEDSHFLKRFLYHTCHILRLHFSQCRGTYLLIKSYPGWRITSHSFRKYTIFRLHLSPEKQFSTNSRFILAHQHVHIVAKAPMLRFVELLLSHLGTQATTQNGLSSSSCPVLFVF